MAAVKRTHSLQWAHTATAGLMLSLWVWCSCAEKEHADDREQSDREMSSVCCIFMYHPVAGCWGTRRVSVKLAVHQKQLFFFFQLADSSIDKNKVIKGIPLHWYFILKMASAAVRIHWSTAAANWLFQHVPLRKCYQMLSNFWRAGMATNWLEFSKYLLN